jgi:hypothetical protein
VSQLPEFDVVAAHKHFSAHCFNRAWDLIEKADRTPDEDQLMVALNQASIFHWRSRPDCNNRRLAVGYWQASRIQAVLGNAREAQRYAEICLAYSGELEPFHLGYAHEALARAAALSGDSLGLSNQLALAEAQAALVVREEDREALRKDLAALK